MTGHNMAMNLKTELSPWQVFLCSHVHLHRGRLEIGRKLDYTRVWFVRLEDKSKRMSIVIDQEI